LLFNEYRKKKEKEREKKKKKKVDPAFYVYFKKSNNELAFKAKNDFISDFFNDFFLKNISNFIVFVYEITYNKYDKSFAFKAVVY